MVLQKSETCPFLGYEPYLLSPEQEKESEQDLLSDVPCTLNSNVSDKSIEIKEQREWKCSNKFKSSYLDYTDYFYIKTTIPVFKTNTVLKSALSA